MNRTRTSSSYSYTSYKRSIQCTASFEPLTPSSVEELKGIVLFTLEQHYHLKVVGSLHSVTDCICTDGILVKMTNFKHFQYNRNTQHATGGPGWKLMDFLEQLHASGRGLVSSPIYGDITLGGAIGTGAHGSALRHPATLSDQLFSVTFVDGRGNVRKVKEDEDFKAIKLNLGLLGIVFELTFKTTEQYKLEVDNYQISDYILWRDDGDLIRMAEGNDIFQFFWFPNNKQVVMSVGNKVGVNTSGNCESHLVTEMPFVNSNGLSTTFELMQGTENHLGQFLVSYIISYEEK